MIKNSVYIKSAGTEICLKIFKNIELKPKAYVVLLTGDGLKGLKSSSWPPLIEKLVSDNYTVIGFDFISQGDSRGLRENLNLSTGIENLNDTINYINSNFPIEKLFFVASSFGGSVLLAHKIALTRANGIVFKSPASNLIETYENELPFLKIEDWENNGINPETGIAFEAYKNALNYDLYDNLSKIKCPVLIIQGSNDQIVFLEHSERLNSLIGQQSKLVILEGVKHNYKQNNALDRFFNLTINHFNSIINGKYIEKNI